MSKLLNEVPELAELLVQGTARGRDGGTVRMHSGITLPNAEGLNRAMEQFKPKWAVEIGMAYGVSTLAILSGLRANGGQLVSIDPFQSTQWGSCGVAAVERAGFADRHHLIEEPDYQALPRLLKDNHRFDFGYIDGWHTFDYALLDFWYLDRMLTTGGVIAFNDCGFPAVHKVIDFVLSHRKYEEVDVGIPLQLVDRSTFTATGARRRQHFFPAQDRYFVKKEAGEPNWDFFADF